MKLKKYIKDATSAYSSPRVIKSPESHTKMSPKAAKTPLFDKSAHSSTKEIIRGTSSNWVGSPKEVIRDTSHHNEPASGPKSPRRSSKAFFGVVIPHYV
jgi:hypothetical protein